MGPYTFQLVLKWGHHAQAQEAASPQGWMVWIKAQHIRGLAKGGDEVKGVSGLRMMVSQGTHAGIIMVGRNGRVLIVTPSLLFISFFSCFIPWLRF